MRKAKVQALLMCILMLLTINVGFAITLNPPKIRGRLTLPNNVKCVGDSILFAYKLPYQPELTMSVIVIAVTDSSGQFQIDLPSFTEPVQLGYGNVYFRGKKGHIASNEKFFPENGDDVFMDIVLAAQDSSDKVLFKSITFSGKGADKYNATVRIGALRDRYLKDLSTLYGSSDIDTNSLKTPNHYGQKLLNFNKFCEKYFNEKKNIINDYPLGDKLKRMIGLDNGVLFFSDWISRQLFHYQIEFKDDPETRSIIKKNVKENIDKYKPAIDSLMIYCRSNIFDFLNTESMCFQMLSKDDQVSASKMYIYTKSAFTGRLREQLLVNLFVSNLGFNYLSHFDPEEVDSMMIDAQQYIKSPLAKDYYLASLHLKPGKPVFNGRFADVDGKEVSLESLKGKVVFLDIWGDGCGACARFHEQFHKSIYPHLRGNKDFVYLSINSDRKKSTWLRLKDNGRYTVPEYLNVFTGDQIGFDHPFFRYYRIGSIPFTLLLDKQGDIVQSRFDSENKLLEMIKIKLAADIKSPSAPSGK